MRPRYLAGFPHYWDTGAWAIPIEAKLGEEFIRRYLRADGFDIGNGGRTSKTDLQIEGRQFEIKTASLGANGTFQFNHVRLDRNYRFCCVWEFARTRSSSVCGAKGGCRRQGREACSNVRRAAVTHKITKKLDQLHPIEDLPTRLREAFQLEVAR